MCFYVILMKDFIDSGYQVPLQELILEELNKGRTQKLEGLSEQQVEWCELAVLRREHDPLFDEACSRYMEKYRVPFNAAQIPYSE